MKDDFRIEASPLCASELGNSIAAHLLDSCLRAFDRFAGKQRIAALVLMGSFSRGEGSIWIDDSGIAHVLGDIEFFAVLGEGSNLATSQKHLNELSATAERELAEQRINCKVEFSAVARNYFSRIRPSIFNYELQKHGKVVWGNQNIIGEIPPFGHEQIPPEDGFFLLCNRIVEQLIALRSMDESPSDQRYQLMKLYLDMAGSYLVVSGSYAPTYAERVGICSAAMASENVFQSPASLEKFLDTLGSCTAYKLSPNETDCQLMSGEYSPSLFKKLFKETAVFCRDIWQWEIRRLFETAGDTVKWTGPAGRSLGLRMVIREWLKFLLMARRSGRKVSLERMVRLFFKGTPRMLIYAAAAHLYFSLAEDREIDSQRIEMLLPNPCRLKSQNEAVDAVIDAWNTFVRSA